MLSASKQIYDSIIPAREVSQKPSTQVSVAIGLFIVVCGLLLVSPFSSLLIIIYPALASIVALFVYSRSKPSYVAFTMWIWFLTSFVRRVVDAHAGAEQIMLLTPYLVGGIAGIYLLCNLGRLTSPKLLPFSCALAAILYGLCVGLFHFSILTIAPSLCEWLVPVLFAVFLYGETEEHSKMCESFENAFCWMLVLSGAYGIYQFFALPAWDAAWLEANRQLLSFGTAEPMKFRAFGTMNSPQTFGIALMVGLLMLPHFKKAVRIPAGVLGFVALLLTTSRSAWIGIVVGMVFLATQMDKRRLVYLSAALLVISILVIGILQVPLLNTLVSDRLGSFTDLQEDTSYADRMQGYKGAVTRILHEPFGEGLGSAEVMHSDESIGPHDSSFLESLYSLGWIGTLIYASGIVVAVIGVFRSARDPRDGFIGMGRAIMISYAVQSPLNSVTLGVSGFVLWAAIALTLKEVDEQKHGKSNSFLISYSLRSPGA